MNEEAIFEAASNGQAILVQELLDSGVDVNLRDFDRDDTPLHMAAAKGQKGIMEMLVEYGADVNAQNNRGQTPLHSLVKKRFDLLALWLVRQGADINLEDDKGCSARDYALDWFQADLDEAAAGALPEGAADAMAAYEAEQARAAAAEQGELAPGGGGATPGGEVIKVYLRNESYKTMLIGSADTARDLCQKMAKKLGIEQCAHNMEIITANAGDERRMTPGELLFDVKSRWTSDDAKFILVLQRGTPSSIVQQFRAVLR